MLGIVTDDADFLGDRSDVTRIAQNLRGSAEFAPRVGLSALIGSVRLQVSDQKFVNVDVIHRVVGLRKEDVRKHAFAMVIGDTQARIMHPLDVLKSRIENLGLTEKQNSQGIAQAGLSILIASKYIRDVAKDPKTATVALKAIEQVVTIAKSSAGRRASRIFGISFIEAIPSDAIANENFRNERLPRILEELRIAAKLSA